MLSSLFHNSAHRVSSVTNCAQIIEFLHTSFVRNNQLESFTMLPNTAYRNIFALLVFVLFVFALQSQGRRRRGGQGGTCLPTFKSGGGGAQVGLCPPPPTFGQSKCSNFTICTYFVVKNTIFSKFSWLASLANFNKSIFSKIC